MGHPLRSGPGAPSRVRRGQCAPGLRSRRAALQIAVGLHGYEMMIAAVMPAKFNPVIGILTVAVW